MGLPKKICVLASLLFFPDMNIWPEMAFPPEIAIQPEMAFLLSNQSALLFKVLKGLARL